MSNAEVVEEKLPRRLVAVSHEAEKRVLLQPLTENPKARPQAVREIVWAVLNAKEFEFLFINVPSPCGRGLW